MEVIHGTRKRKASNFAPQDYISNMPDIMVTNILDRLPIQDAVRTSILSRNWRFKWTILSQLVFEDNFFKCFSKTNDKYHVRVISRILLHLRGAITKFSLMIKDLSDAEDINNWILFLSRRGIKELTLRNWAQRPFKLPTHLFSCLELKHLKLTNCYFNPPPRFHGFPNLLSLDLCVVFEENIHLGKFFTRCPLLENLTMNNLYEDGEVRVFEITELKNLIKLSLKAYYIDDFVFDTVFAFLGGSLPKLQELELDLVSYKLIKGGDKKRFSTAFPCLKVLKLVRIRDSSMESSSCMFELIRSLPNLQTLEIGEYGWNDGSLPQVDYNTAEPLQLQCVMFGSLTDSEEELWLIKYLLLCSPFLKRIVIHPNPRLLSDKKLMLASKLLKLHRASTVAEIDFVNR